MIVTINASQHFPETILIAILLYINAMIEVWLDLLTKQMVRERP